MMYLVPLDVEWSIRIRSGVSSGTLGTAVLSGDDAAVGVVVVAIAGLGKIVAGVGIAVTGVGMVIAGVNEAIPGVGMARAESMLSLYVLLRSSPEVCAPSASMSPNAAIEDRDRSVSFGTE